MKNTTLVIMAAGLGSRFSGGIKQLEKVGVNGEILMEYAVDDAIKAGFNKIVFVIRKDIEDDFKYLIGNKVSEKIRCEYVFQELDDIPSGFNFENRVKPWGTGHAVLAARKAIVGPFCVINADDYYGPEAFQLVHQFLVNNEKDNEYCFAGFTLNNTLSDNGGVNRGICTVNKDGFLIDITETHNIAKCGKVIISDNGELDPESIVSLSFWGFKESFLDELEKEFVLFFKNLDKNDLRKEFYLPDVIDKMVKEKRATVKFLKSHDKWLGVTYHEDKKMVVDELKKKYVEGLYK